jgi:hypothetical protein
LDEQPLLSAESAALFGSPNAITKWAGCIRVACSATEAASLVGEIRVELSDGRTGYAACKNFDDDNGRITLHIVGLTTLTTLPELPSDTLPARLDIKRSLLSRS